MHKARRNPRGFSLARMFRLRPLERGQTSTEYIGMVVVVVAIIGALVGAGVSTELGQSVGNKICQVFGGDCGESGGGDDQPAADGQNDDSDSDSDPDAEQVKSPEDKEYDDAKKQVEDLEKALEADKEKAKEAAEALIKILADELGITAALDCVMEGDASACGETVLNILTSLVGGAVGKLAAKYGAPWKWKQAAALVKKIKKHGGDVASGLTGILDKSKKLKKARERLAKAEKSCNHSFLPGTAVLLADGTRTSIEKVRAGDLVTVTDPQRGLTTTRPVADTITTEDDKDFTRLTVRTGGRTTTITATDTHPFWLTDQKRWAEASDIKPGAKLRTPQGESLPVVGVSQYQKQQRTHDLSIEGIHTYYVEIGDSAALVHNCPAKKPTGSKEWQADSSVTGPAAGKTLKPPNARHTVSGAKHGQVKEKNSVILKGKEADVDADIKAIAEGRAKLVDNGSRYEINGRKYGVEDSGRVYPDSGPGIVDMDRNEYAALKEIAKANGDVNAPSLTKNPRFANNPQAVEKAKKVYDGTYK